MFKLDNFGIIPFLSTSYKKFLQCSIYGHLKKSKFERFFMFFRFENFFKNDPIRANFMRGIDCAHFQRFPDPESGNQYVWLKRKFLVSLLENDLLRANLCGASVARIPKAWKRFPAPDSGNGVDVLTRKSSFFSLKASKRFPDSGKVCVLK